MAKKGAWKRVIDVINRSDVVLEVLDARFPRPSSKLENIIKRKKKILIRILNKSDLLGKSAEVKAKKLKARIFSAKKGIGKRELLGYLRYLAKKKGSKLWVGVVGLPNVGKSSLINRLKGKKSAKTSPIAGYTRGEQWIKIDDDILLIDSPGIIPFEEEEEELAIMGYKNPEALKDPYLAALELLKKYPKIMKILDLPNDPEKAIEEFGRRNGKLMKGGEVNLDEAAKMLIRKWQRGYFI